MQKIKATIPEWLLAISVSAIWFTLMAGFGFAVKEKGISSGDAAGWAQAFGSVVGVGVTVFFFYSSTQSQKLEAKRKKDALKAGLLSLSDRTFMLIESVENGSLYTSLIQVHLKNHLYQEYIKYIQFEIQAIESILLGVTLDKLAEADVVDSGLYLRQALNGFNARVASGFQIDSNNSGIPINATKAHFQHMKNFVKLAQDILLGKTPTIVDYRRRQSI